MSERRSATSTSRSAVRARKLHKRSYRYEAGLFLAEGPQAVREGLRASAIQQLFVDSSCAAISADLVETALASDCEVIDVDQRTLASIADTVNPQGLVAIAELPSPQEHAILPGQTLVVILEQMGDPGNVGTIIRIADAAGADAVALTPGSADPFSPKSVRASAGSVFHIPVASGVTFAAIRGLMKQHSMNLLAATGSAPLSLYSDEMARTLSGPVAWLFGNEAHGVSSEALAASDAQVAIPIYGKAESLNVAAAAAICLYETARTASGSGPAERSVL